MYFKKRRPSIASSSNFTFLRLEVRKKNHMFFYLYIYFAVHQLIGITSAEFNPGKMRLRTNWNDMTFPL